MCGLYRRVHQRYFLPSSSALCHVPAVPTVGQCFRFAFLAAEQGPKPGPAENETAVLNCSVTGLGTALPVSIAEVVH